LLVRGEHETAVDFGTRVEKVISGLDTCCRPDFSQICRALKLRRGGGGSASGCAASALAEILVFGGDHEDVQKVTAQTKGRASEHGWDGKLKFINLR
jgi:hypothetical protein